MQPYMGVLMKSTGLVCLVLAFGLPGVAQAKSIATPALQKHASQWFNCRIVNLSGKALNSTPTIRILGADGSPLAMSEFTGPLNSGGTASVGYTDTDRIGYCVVEVEGWFLKPPIRTTFCVRNPGGGCITAVTAP